MNVVGKVRSLISQGVYSVATPFHPFGGAVDIIVVEQQDGTYQSTPWYVRFGKFQGVLKGTENTILISVNGVETDVNMLLDNSGEAYFARLMLAGDQEEADTQSSIDIHNDYTNSVSISSIQDASDSNFYSSSNVDNAENNEQENDAFCNGLQSFNVASNGSSELDSHNYGDLHEVVGAAESSQDSSIDMVFVSVNGHVLTAPISESEENVENLELTSPKIYLGPDESSNEEFISKVSGQAAGSAFVNDAESSSPFWNHNIFSLGVPKDWHDLDSTHDEENLETTMTYKKVDPRLSKNETFASCLDFSELISDIEVTNSQDLGSPNAVNTTNVVKGPEEDKKEAVNDIKDMEQIKHESVICDRKELETKEDKNAATIIPKVEIDNVSAYPKHDVRPLGTQQPHPDAKLTDDCRIAKGASGHGVKGNDHDIISTPKYDIEQDEHAQSGFPWITNEDFEVSLCGNLLCPGVGSKFAAEVFETHRISKCETSVHLIARNERLILRFRGKYFSWNKVAPIVLGENLSIQLKDPIPVEEENTNPINSGEDISNSSQVGPGWRLWPIPFRRTRSPPSAVGSSVGSSHSSQFPPEEFIRTNIPTTEQITSLNLKYGQNLITFTFCTRVLGRQQVDAHIYLWKWNARIVISDVDGTITKSDVLGQFMPLVGKDWTQSGVAHLFSAIKENGYQLLFLSARAIVQSYLTRNFLRSLRQDGQTLPNGPIVISPDGLFPSLYREVIRRTPHEFKIACLEDIKALFPSGHNPFYAGFGNRDTDELSYQKIGIPKGKIFIINPKGEVAINRHIDVKTYTSLHSLVDDMFPPTSLIEQEDYNSWNYWKVPLPHIDC